MADKNKTNKLEVNSVISLDQVLELLHDKKKLYWLNFKAGFIRGFAGVLGAALAVVLLGYLVASFGGLTIIGDFISQLGQGYQTTTK